MTPKDLVLEDPGLKIWLTCSLWLHKAKGKEKRKPRKILFIAFLVESRLKFHNNQYERAGRGKGALGGELMCKMTCLRIQKAHLEFGTRVCFFLRAYNLFLVAGARSSYLTPILSISRHQYITTDCILNSPQRYKTTERFMCYDLPLQLHVNSLDLKAFSHINKARVTGLEVLTVRQHL